MGASASVGVPGPAGTVTRLATAGSVDDGKSTLVGRLLHDTRSVLADQFEAVQRAGRDRGLDGPDLALLTDGLRAEREQGITIDVAHRYFATGTRMFILADCPGHVQYTRNTVTGASTADILVVLVDARNGVVEQTRRHLAVAALLALPHVVVAVNKVDLVGFAESAVHRVDAQVRRAASALGLAGVHTVPVCALDGDNVVTPSPRTPWYRGPGLLELLERLPVGTDDADRPFRMPVQLVIRAQRAAAEAEPADYRGYAGQVAAGQVSVGDPVVALPSGRRSRLTGIELAGRPLRTAVAGQSVTLRLSDDLDVSRGELLAGTGTAPEPARRLDATVCWLAERPLHPGDRVLVKYGTSIVRARAEVVGPLLDVVDLRPLPARDLRLNDLGRVGLRLATPLPVEPYTARGRTGAFLVIDPEDGATLAAGMVGPVPAQPDGRSPR